ncbi:superoxide dismutase family protein [Burkholderia sp. 22PA0106]|uniref:superoxide dismutase family protein n=1 Tax=Burkholderia sp. 22PA0106 TaxID=3237371 RepID=UPI0039C2E838
MKQRFDGTACATALAVLAAMVVLNGCTSFASTHEKRATALLQPTFGSQTRGALTFVERPDGVQVSYNFVGLPPDTDHALQVHDRGDCNAVDGASAGPVFAPSADRLRAGARVAGDLGNIHADSNGVAAGFIVAPDVALDGVRSVFGRSVLIHRDAGDPAFPQHGPGPGLACGVVRP